LAVKDAASAGRGKFAQRPGDPPAHHFLIGLRLALEPDDDAAGG